MFCPECGAPNDDDAVYCGNCGSLMNPDAVPAAEGDETPLAASLETPDAGAFEQAQGLEDEEILPVDETPMRAAIPEPPPSPSPPVYRSTPAQTSGLAIASLVAGIAGWTMFPLLGSILAIVLGYAARREIRQQPDRLTGEGMAVAGLVLGWLAVGLTAVGVCFGAIVLWYALNI